MPDPHPLIGVIHDPSTVARYVQDHLRAWSETYLAALGYQHHGDPNHYPIIASWGSVPDTSPDTPVNRQYQAPGVLVTPSFVRSTVGQDDAQIGAFFPMSVLVYTVADTEANAMHLASVYGASIWATVVQQPYLPQIEGAQLIFDEQEVADRPNGHITEGWSLVDLTVQLPVIAGYGSLNKPLVGRELPDPSTLPIITDVTQRIIAR